MSTPTKEDVIRAAEEAHARYPQYRGHWRGPEWKLVLVRRTVRTKMGVAFERGDVTVARPDPCHPCYVTAYSLRNAVDTMLDARDVVEMVDLQRFMAVRMRLERLAAHLGASKLKQACCELALDEGDGRMAARALGALRSLPFRHGGVDDVIREIESLLEEAA